MTEIETRLALAEATAAASLAAATEEELLSAVHALLAEAGIDLLRMSVGAVELSPTHDLRMTALTRGKGFSHIAVDTRLESVEFMATVSPFVAMWLNKTEQLRVRLGAGEDAGFAFLAGLRAEGATDFLAVSFALPTARLPGGDTTIMSFVADSTDGFSERDLARLHAVARQLALGATLTAASRSGAAALDTYLGPLAGARVREGNILRGRAEPMRAVVWASDLVGFTRITESVETEELLSLLNDYTGELVAAVGAHGGEVLKFIGDGLLAIFPADAGGPAAALSAAREARKRVTALSEARRAAGLVSTDFCLGLHLGEVLFGNFGAAGRLDFTVLGPAVNEVSRMLGLSKTLDQRVLASAAFHAELGERSAELVSVGRYALRGVGAPQHLFTLEAD